MGMGKLVYTGKYGKNGKNCLFSKYIWRRILRILKSCEFQKCFLENFKCGFM
jgi:hypothetical protein